MGDVLTFRESVDFPLLFETKARAHRVSIGRHSLIATGGRPQQPGLSLA